MTRKIIIDTDPGIDDAMAILLALNTSKLDVLALTTTFGNVAVDLATKNALTLLELAGSNIPVAQGVSKPLVAPALPHPDFVHGTDGFGNINWPVSTRQADSRSAAQLIVDMVHKYPNQVSLVALGPLGNLAKAIELDPSIIELVDEVILMGGAAEEKGNVTPVAEANIINDPHAADIVFGANWSVTMVGLDVTHQVLMDNDLLAYIRDNNGECGDFLYKATQFYFEFYKKTFGIDGCFVHDASTIVYAVEPDIFTTEQRVVRVAVDGVGIGQTITAKPQQKFALDFWENKPLTNVCMGVDSTRLLMMIKETFSH
jgi:inosine-uridine nucleoside N-ribohydrolase